MLKKQMLGVKSKFDEINFNRQRVLDLRDREDVIATKEAED